MAERRNNVEIYAWRYMAKQKHVRERRISGGGIFVNRPSPMLAETMLAALRAAFVMLYHRSSRHYERGAGHEIFRSISVSSHAARIARRFSRAVASLKIIKRGVNVQSISEAARCHGWHIKISLHSRSTMAARPSSPRALSAWAAGRRYAM